MKIALAPDLHCFYATYGRLDKNSRNFRETEWLDIANAMYKECIEHKVDVCIAPGDLFTNPRPSANQILMVSHLFSRLENSGIKVLGISGNHDVGISGSKTSNDVVGAIGGTPLWCVQEPTTVVVNDIGFAFLPFMRDLSLLAYNPNYANLNMADKLISITQELFNKLEEQQIGKKILIGHYTISGAISSSGQNMDSSKDTNEVILPLGSLVQQGWTACMFGHIHKPQVLSQKPFVAYSGCFQRINISESSDERGFYIYDTETEEYEFVPLPAIEMIRILGKINTESDGKQFMDKICSTEIKGKIIQVKYEISKENIALLNRNEIFRLVDSKEPLAIAGVAPHIKEVIRQRDVSLTEALDGKMALQKWMENKGILKESQKKIINLFESIKLEMSKAATGGM